MKEKWSAPMLAKAPFSTLCLLSLAVPLLGHARSWLFSGTSENNDVTIESAIPASSEIAMSSRMSSPSNPNPPPNQSKKIWECAASIGIGYRQDKISQRYTPTHNSALQRVKFKYHDVNSVMGLVRFDARVSNFLFNLEGDYSPVVSGMLSAPFNTDADVGRDFNFHFKKLTGYEADAMASVGYRLQFMNGCRSRAALIFQVGYRYSHQTYETDAQSKSSKTTFVSILQDQAPMHSEWFGPFLEGRISFSYLDQFYFQPFYQYHFLDYRAQRHEAQKVYSYAGGSPPVPFDFLVKFTTQGDEGRGQLAGIDTFYQPKCTHLRFGLKGTYLEFQSNETKTKAKLREVFLSTNPSTSVYSKPKYHSHANWHSYSISGYAGYSF